MDFFEHQDAARRASRRLLVMFGLSVTAVVLVVMALASGAVLLVGAQQGPLDAEALARLPLWPTAGLAGLGTLLLIGGGSIFKTMQLAGGGAAVARSVGARRVEADTHDPFERRLLNVVEEMALAAGCPVPGVVLMEDEDGINAFAAGWSLDDAVIGVTHGAMHQLSRDELQGVVAHEFSHILHGDMRLNLRLLGLVFGLLAVSVLGAVVMRAVGQGMSYGRYQRRGRRDGRDGGGEVGVVVAVFAAGVALYAVGSIGVLFGRMIQAALSRQREFLADASAVQYTRNPDGIGNALRRIGGAGSRLQTAHAVEHSHLFFGKPFGSAWGAGFASHPPLEQRIARLLPHWDGKYLAPREGGARPADDVRGTRHVRVAGSIPGAALRGLAGTEVEDAEGAAEKVGAVTQIGAFTPAHLERARELMAGLPAGLRETVRTPVGAQAVVFALLRDPQVAEVTRKQQAYLGEHAAPEVRRAMLRWAPEVAALNPASRLPLLDLALPALQQMHPRDRRGFEATVDAMVGADQRLELFEWALRQTLWRHLVGPAAARMPRDRRLADYADDLAVLLTVLAHVNPAGSARRAEAAAAAFGAGREHAPELAGAAPVTGRVSMARLTDAVDRLAMLRPLDTRRVVHACAATVAGDRKVTVREIELLRAVAETLDVPMPPLLPGQRLI